MQLKRYMQEPQLLCQSEVLLVFHSLVKNRETEWDWHAADLLSHKWSEYLGSSTDNFEEQVCRRCTHQPIYNLFCARTGSDQFFRHQTCLNYLWHRLRGMLETLLRDLIDDRIKQMLQIGGRHLQDGNIPLHHILKVLHWIEIWLQWIINQAEIIWRVVTWCIEDG